MTSDHVTCSKKIIFLIFCFFYEEFQANKLWIVYRIESISYSASKLIREKTFSFSHHSPIFHRMRKIIIEMKFKRDASGGSRVEKGKTNVCVKLVDCLRSSHEIEWRTPTLFCSFPLQTLSHLASSSGKMLMIKIIIFLSFH